MKKSHLILAKLVKNLRNESAIKTLVLKPSAIKTQFVSYYKAHMYR